MQRSQGHPWENRVDLCLQPHCSFNHTAAHLSRLIKENALSWDDSPHYNRLTNYLTQRLLTCPWSVSVGSMTMEAVCCLFTARSSMTMEARR